MPRYLAASTARRKAAVYQQLLVDIADCRNTRPRRKRQCPRVVKVKMSKFPLKNNKREKVLDTKVHLK